MSPRFSSRVPRDLTQNRLSRAVARHRSAGRTLIDLTISNPTRVGIEYPGDILAPLADAASRVYRPEPLGLRDARAAVARDYERRGTSVAADRIVLTASTSEAYSLLFKLLCDPGDTVLVPAPSYPLFEHLSALDAVRASSYALVYYGRWMVDEHSVAREWTDTTRAVLAVSPNNPTGSLLSKDDWTLLSATCAARDAALIVDEVFIDYLFEPDPRTHGPTDPRTHGPTDPRTHGPRDVLTFRLGGLSKSAGLPQVKLGWIAVEGPDAAVGEALQRLEIICDAYLSVSTPVQAALPALIERALPVRQAIVSRIRRNYAALKQEAAAHPHLQLLDADGGWSAVMRIPATTDEEDLVLTLLDAHGVLVHPGFFFDFPDEGFLVLSLLPPPADFDEGVRRLTAALHV